MEGLVILLVLFALWVFIAPIVAMVKAGSAEREARETRDQLQDALKRLKAVESELQQFKSGPTPEIPVKNDRAALEAVLARVQKEEQRLESVAEIQSPPPLPARPKLVDWEKSETPPEAVEPQEPFSLEKFMGVKLFAWLGGVAMFFGVIFFVKYAFENNLISPALRITLGFVTGSALLIGGLLTHRLERYRVLAQAFCATGVLILYGVSFAAHAIYHFPAFGTLTTFGLMAVITTVAFLIAVRLNALVVAVLGMLGGFMTPVLLSTGQDQMLGLFGYIALLDIGLLAVSRHGRWRFLTGCAAAGTALMQIGWFEKFFSAGRYFDGSKTLVPMGILLGFIVLFLAGGWIARRKISQQAALAVLGLVAVAVLFSFWMLGFRQVAERHILLYGFLLLAQFTVIIAVMSRPRLGWAQVIAAGLAFVHLACWTTRYLNLENLNGTLLIYLIFGALHAVAPVIVFRRMPANAARMPLKAGPWFAPLVLLLMLLPVFYLSPVPMAIWAAILIADLLVIGLAVATRAVVPVLASLVLTMGVAAIWLFKVPAKVDSLMPFLGVITGFSAVFAVAGRWLSRANPDSKTVAILPVYSGVLPFSLLILALLQLPVVNPAPIFGVALLMSALLAALAIFGKQGSLLLVALGGTLAVEMVWHLQSHAGALPWYLGIYGMFLVFPFVFHKACADLAGPWIASALSGVGHFLLVHDLMKREFPNDLPGLVPAAFAVPALISLFAVLKMFPEMDEKQRSRLAWFGAVALLFITLIFPIQFERQWIIVSWAVEGALLLWLFRRVQHPGLQLTGLALLAVSFIRLTLNPAAFNDYPRSGTAILNWHLYAYGVVAAAQFSGGGWFTDPAGRWSQIHPRAVLFAFGGVLLFLLLNIEIADYFTAPGERFIAFRFGGNFARDMTYSIAWGLFSLGLLGIGFRCGSKHARLAAVGLLVVTLLKVFLHDLAAIQNIFRIGALVGVAVIAFIASFLYQRFFDRPKA
ncbi:MAG: hypothetical protein RLZZ214_3414 [Verrucomicrobiota bacterium]